MGMLLQKNVSSAPPPQNPNSAVCPPLMDSSENFSNSVLYLAENWMRDTVFLSFEMENWMWLLRLRHNRNLLCELNFIGQ